MILHRGLARGYIVMPSYGQAHILKYLLHTKLFSLYYREGMIFLKLNIVRRSRHLGWWDWGPPGQGESLQSGTERALDECWLLFSCSVMSDSLWPHGLQHTRPSCPSPTPGAYSNSCSSCQRCHPTISSSAVPLSSRCQSFPISQLFTSGGQSIGVLASASVFPMNAQDWFPLEMTAVVKNSFIMEAEAIKASIKYIIRDIV